MNIRARKQFQCLLKDVSTKTQKIKPAINAYLVDGNILHWKAQIEGPQGLYQGGFFQIDIIIPPQYPNGSPPKMKFDTNIWHPNISSKTGAIYLDILIDLWSPALSIYHVLISLQSLLASPEHEHACDQAVVQEYRNDPSQFQKHAKEWVKRYAMPKIERNEEDIDDFQIFQEPFQQSFLQQTEQTQAQNKINIIVINKYMQYLNSILPQ